MCAAQFVTVLEANIFAKINALVNVTITKVTSGSAIVENTVAFTSSDDAAAKAGQAALFQSLQARDTSVFGATFGSVGVSSVTQGTTANPGKSFYGCVDINYMNALDMCQAFSQYCLHTCSCCSVACEANDGFAVAGLGSGHSSAATTAGVTGCIVAAAALAAVLPGSF